MDTRKLTLAAAIGALIAGGMANANHHEGATGEKVKCYGVAKSGQNDCATSSHSCAGAAKADNDPSDWKSMPKEDCEKAGGKAEAPKAAQG